jgi:hypothetical protein
MPSTTAALRRPAPPATVPQGQQAQQRRLPSDSPLRAALAVLQLAKVPSSIGSLAAKVTALHPTPKSWTWAHRDAYALVFDHIAAASGSTARASGGPGRRA